MDASKDEGGNENLDDVDTTHLEDIDDGCGCAEVWEEMSERREASD